MLKIILIYKHLISLPVRQALEPAFVIRYYLSVTNKWTLGQRHIRVLVHFEEFESAESIERCMWLWWETDYVSSYDMWWCPQLHLDRPVYSNPYWCQLCQTLGGVYLTVTIEGSMKNVNYQVRGLWRGRWRSSDLWAVTSESRPGRDDSSRDWRCAGLTLVTHESWH